MDSEIFNGRDFCPREARRAEPLVGGFPHVFWRGKTAAGIKRFETSKNRCRHGAVELLVRNRFNQRLEWAPMISRLEGAGTDFLN